MAGIRGVLYHDDPEEGTIIELYNHLLLVPQVTLIKAITEDQLVEGEWMEDLKNELHKAGHPHIQENDERSLTVIDHKPFADVLLTNFLITNLERNYIVRFAQDAQEEEVE